MRFVTLCTVVALAGVVSAHGGAVADDATPTLPVETPQVTLAVSSPESTPAAYPTVVRERSAPVSTLSSEPTELAIPPATSAPPVAYATPVPVPTPLPTVSAGTVTQPYAPLPSPDELRANARLRWGTRVPAKVSRWAFLIVPAARRYGLDANIVAAVMTMESGGDPLAWSGADARGLMQILHGPWDPHDNVYEGARMLSELFNQFGSWDLALAAYNAGPNAVITYGGVPPFRETRDYVIVVSYLYDLYARHKLTHTRRALYRSTLRDLERFSQQRKKIRRLAKAGHVTDGLSLLCGRRSPICDSQALEPLFSTLDPFWPLSGSPDPLQQVGPPE